MIGSHCRNYGTAFVGPATRSPVGDKLLSFRPAARDFTLGRGGNAAILGVRCTGRRAPVPFFTELVASVAKPVAFARRKRACAPILANIPTEKNRQMPVKSLTDNKKVKA